MLTFRSDRNAFVWQGAFETRALPREAGFSWSVSGRCWWTASPYVAHVLAAHADPAARAALARVTWNLQASAAKTPLLDVPKGAYPFQAAGVEVLADQYRQGRRALFLADEQGLGKTIQALLFADRIGAKRLLVVCPASLRLNWAREIETWHRGNPGVDVVLKGTHAVNKRASLVTSYSLGEVGCEYEADLVIVDESHYLKNAGTARTQLLLGNGGKWPGLARRGAPALFLTGTPLPNGKPSELWPLLFRCAPEVINHAGYWPFARQYCTIDESPGTEPRITGAKNERELFCRLRGSGFMVRRLLRDVIQDLPRERYQMVVFPVTGATRKVLQKEEQFSAREIIAHGVPVGTALPELRREMGVAKVPQALEYVTNLLDGGVEKVVVYAHHREVMGELEHGLRSYRPVVIVGGTPAKKRQEAVDTFQRDPGVRVFLGNEAAEEGITLTAASHVVLVEPEWVPGKNAQRVSRLVRIGQTERVLVHLLVVEQSLDAQILGSAANKAADITAVLDRAN